MLMPQTWQQARVPTTGAGATFSTTGGGSDRLHSSKMSLDDNFRDENLWKINGFWTLGTCLCCTQLEKDSCGWWCHALHHGNRRHSHKPQKQQNDRLRQKPRRKREMQCSLKVALRSLTPTTVPRRSLVPLQGGRSASRVSATPRSPHAAVPHHTSVELGPSHAPPPPASHQSCLQTLGNVVEGRHHVTLPRSEQALPSPPCGTTALVVSHLHGLPPGLDRTKKKK